MNASNKLKTENEKLKTENSIFRFQFSLISFQFLRKGPAQIAAILAIAYALKYHYSVATVNGLRWILAPTTFLVETITGRGFTFESQAGYMSSDHTFLIAASCSGVNFMIIGFVMLAIGELWRREKMEWRFLPVAFLVAYIATLLANTARIVIALSMHDSNLEIGSMNSDELHRLEGIVVYFGSLLALFVITETVARGTSVSQLARRSILPLAIYYAVTLGVPLAGGAYSEMEFWKHAVVVILAPLIVILPLIVFSLARSGEASELA